MKSRTLDRPTTRRYDAPVSAEERVRQFILHEWLRDESMELSLDEPLFSSGLLDSFAISGLILFLEDELRVRIPVVQVRIEDFDTIARGLAAARSLGKPVTP